VYDSPEKAAGAMVTLWKRTLITRRKKSTPSVMPSKNGEASAVIAAALERRQTGLDEHQAKRVLASYGIPVAREILVTSGKEAAEAASSIGYPVALKACHWSIQHKTGSGLMALDITGEAGLLAAVEGIRSAAGPEAGILVQEMIKGKREFMAGMARFPGFGPAVLFGFGGIFTEIMDDSSLRMAPFGTEDALEMMREIRSAPLLDEFRGMPRADRERLASILCTVGHIALLHPEIGEMDLNPIIINGAEPVTADALIVLK
jgi:acetyltransferase